MQKSREKAAELDHLREGYQKVLHPRVKALIGHLHLPLLDWLLREIGFEDEDYLASLMRGRPVLGQAADSSANVACWFTCEVDLEEWAKNPRARNEQMLRKIRPSKDRSDKAAWDKTKKAISKGYERGPYAIHRKNLDEVCFTPRFAKWEQKEDGSCTARNITDLKASGANSTVEVLRKYCPEDLTHALALHRAIREQMPVGTRIMGYRADWEMAFQQDPTDPTQAKLLVELQWNPERKAACATESDGSTIWRQGNAIQLHPGSPSDGGHRKISARLGGFPTTAMTPGAWSQIVPHCMSGRSGWNSTKSSAGGWTWISLPRI